MNTNVHQQNSNRFAYIDNLKALMIIFVIMQHVAITYGGVGAWFYTERNAMNAASAYFFFILESFNQAYFMALFFLISAYFIPASLEKKGAKKFIKDRLIRLGIPTLIFMFLILPLTHAIADPQNSSLALYKESIESLEFLTWTGPMWFAVALLIFSICYVPLAKWFTKLSNNFEFSINVKNILIFVALITITAFVIRLVYPIGKLVLNFQLGYFAAYILMFLMGIIAYRKNLLANITYATAKKWFVIAFVVGVPLWNLVIFFGLDQNNVQSSSLLGGWYWSAFGYALWESFFCVTISIGLLGIFKQWFNSQNSLQKFLSTNAFAVYVLHPLVLVTISVSLKSLGLQSVLKFILVTAIAVPLSFIFAALVRKNKLMQKILP